MKHPFLKSAVIVSAVAALMSCSDDGVSNAINDLSLSSASQAATIDVTAEACWVLDADQPYLITTSMVVADANGNVIGSYDEASQTIVNLTGAPIASGIDLNTLRVKNAGEALVATSSSATVSLSSSAIVPTSSSAVAPAVSSAADPAATSSATTQAVSSSSNNTQAASSSSAQQVVNGNITVTGSLTQTVAQGAQTAVVTFSGVSSSDKAQRTSWNAYFLNTNFNNGVFTIQATTVPDYFNAGTITETFNIDGTEYTFTLTVTAASGSTTASSSSVQQQQQQSSSSSVQQQQQSSSSSVWQQSSSSSSAKSSSSTAVSGSTDLVYVSGGKSGSGWATRYWDCCKPSCSWTSNAGSGNEAKQCTVSGSSITDWNTQSVCSGGTAATCTSQIPIIVNDNLAYAFAAVPAADGGACGKCFALTFDGTGKYETKANHQAIKGKVLVVMASNVGTDVSQGQFDIMIPGGGVGIYNGCASMPGWQSGSMGAQYGGLLSDCESSVGYSGDLLTKRKECLVEKCNSVFSGDAVAKEGCLFLANWMQAAGNPNHTYKEVECPAALKAKY